MAINLAKYYVGLLDEAYKLASVSGDLTAPATMIRAGANAKEILYPVMTVTGLGDYSRSSGYTDGAVNLEWKTAAFDYDRGTKIAVDVMDNAESMNLAFGMAGGELIRTQVAPEGDAYTFAKLCAGAGHKIAATLSTVANFMDALQACKTQMDEDEVPESERYLYVTPTLYNMTLRLENYQNRELLDSFAKVVRVPQSRFYSAIDLQDGSNDNFGYVKHVSTGLSDAAGVDINFLVVHKPAVMKFDKHVASDVIRAAGNPDMDADIIKYRKYGICEVFYNKGQFRQHQVQGTSERW